MNFVRIIFAAAVSAVALGLHAENENRWTLDKGGSISWTVSDSPEDKTHTDTIEMAGERVAGNLRYGLNGSGGLLIERWVVWPVLRTIPDNTYGHLAKGRNWNIYDSILIDGAPLVKEEVKRFSLEGLLKVESEITAANGKTLLLTQELFPSPELPAWCDLYSIKNNGKEDVVVEIKEVFEEEKTPAEQGVYGSYDIVQKIDGALFKLSPRESANFQGYVAAYKDGELRFTVDAEKELKERKKFVKKVSSSLVLETPDEVLNRMFEFAKIRASESIFRTEGGLLHSPGGGAYYAAVWANDQAEYANPFFPFLGYENGNEAALNSFMHFSKFIGQCMPSSIIAEGRDHFSCAGDRGDSAMVAYGAARYALARGSKKEAEKLWPLIEWCLEFCESKKNAAGVVMSDSDELEGRFPAGNANLCTSALYYDALVSASYLAHDMGKEELAKTYAERAAQMRKNIEKYFGADVEGFATYRYYDGNDILRSWISIPLCMGIYDRKDGTVAALLSPRLMSSDGLLTQAGTNNFWDRSTLYGLRGIFAAGETEKAYEFLKNYSERRLLGDHVPYAVEAFPEGGQRHLSAESALYARVFTEGVFGIRPTGLNSLSIKPNMPAAWNEMALRKVRMFGKIFDIAVARVGGNYSISLKHGKKLIGQKTIAQGETAEFSMR